MEHTWTIEEIDGGPVGCDDFWICVPCGASGAPVWYDFHEGKAVPRPAPSMGIFFAGYSTRTGRGILSLKWVSRLCPANAIPGRCAPAILRGSGVRTPIAGQSRVVGRFGLQVPVIIGPKLAKRPTTQSRVSLSADCDEAKAQIATHVVSPGGCGKCCSNVRR